MLSLPDRLDELREDLVADPMRISTYHDMPFAIFRYDPPDEYLCRKHIRLLAISLEQNHARNVHFISLGKLLWQAISQTEGIDAVIADEKQRGFENAQKTVHTLISDEDDFMPLSGLIEDRAATLKSKQDIIFLVRAGALAPHIYRCSTLLDKMHGKTEVPIILFYPGTAEGRTDLRFMGMEDRAGTGAYNYRVKIYGGV
ncbi:hypothetical protein HNR65_003170 [Desulfosalsimonas propionicica]|uniref:DUF1788 domain-containing protein n=1 Tax=Desulfosalsimonas propionicica TaxID=332175 RepID=A0A7W0HLY7_9BACT|nr:BREX protein BrxB domain-containing protein [Desulfosalsimonas propionicica]MBA2882815.1 hypothetical protein [Desulfosalsimonas propionicica]